MSTTVTATGTTTATGLVSASIRAGQTRSLSAERRAAQHVKDLTDTVQKNLLAQAQRIAALESALKAQELQLLNEKSSNQLTIQALTKQNQALANALTRTQKELGDCRTDLQGVKASVQQEEDDRKQAERAAQARAAQAEQDRQHAFRMQQGPAEAARVFQIYTNMTQWTHR